MPEDEGRGDVGRRAGSEAAGEGPDRPGEAAPDHEQARQGTRTPPSTEAGRAAPVRGRMSDHEATNWAAGAHLASLVGLVGVPPILGPLVVWLVKRDAHPFVADQARESLNFQLSILIYAFVGLLLAAAFVLATLPMGLMVVMPLAALFVVVALVLPIVAAIKASEGQRYRYPLTLRLISAAEHARPERP